ncbi:MAG TPA: glycosyltransferase family 39 protein [Thermoanaerobaculia bacterium]|jgi:4-amino-4-deoxy-L-arabinose transferase-like glycosyltransferase|nr:glycosyltransferase family 39 protein [Thermoanaerobaculia bacterium]
MAAPTDPRERKALLAGVPARQALLALTSTAFAFRFALLLLPRVIRWDEPVYLLLGRNLWSGLGFTFSGHPELHHSPLFPLLAGATLKLTGRPEAASDVWYVLFGTLLTLPVHGLARRLTSPGGALLAAALVAFFPALTTAVLYWGTMTEPLFLLLIYSAAWLVARGLDGNLSLGAFAAAGALTGLAFLARPEGILWMASLAGAALLILALRRDRGRLTSLAAIPLVFLAVALPQLLFLHRHTGQWMISGKLGITYEIGRAVETGDPVLYDEIINTLDADGEIRAASEARYRRGEAGTAAVKPAEASGRFLRNLGHVLKSSLSSEIFSALLLVPAVWWLLRGPWNRRRLAGAILVAALVAPVASFLAFHVQQRFFAPAFPGLLIWTAAGLRDLYQRLPAGRSRTVSAAVLALALAGYVVWADGEIARHGIATSDFGHQAAGLWLAAHSAPDAAIMTQDTAISVYAGRGYVFSPRAPLDQLLAYGRRHGATHVVVDEAEVTIVRPFLKPLLTQPPPGLTPLWTGRDGHVGRTLVFGARSGAM